MPRRAAKQLRFEFRRHGGARKGAGRPPKGTTAGVSHLARPVVSRRHPVHVTMKALGGLALRQLFPAIRAALTGGRERFGFRLVHFSVQYDHLHLLAEVQDRRALSRGMQGLSIRVAKAVNGRLGRRGAVFADRYHARSLKTPREARLALRYVLLNTRKHAGSSGMLPDFVSGMLPGFVDRCSSAPWFEGWNRPRELVFGSARSRDRESPVVAARTWLLRVGYRRAGPIDPEDRPAQR